MATADAATTAAAGRNKTSEQLGALNQFHVELQRDYFTSFWVVQFCTVLNSHPNRLQFTLLLFYYNYLPLLFSIPTRKNNNANGVWNTKQSFPLITKPSFPYKTQKGTQIAVENFVPPFPAATFFCCVPFFFAHNWIQHKTDRPVLYPHPHAYSKRRKKEPKT